MSNHRTPPDATFLELEEADPSAHVHIGAIVLVSAMKDSVEQLLSATRGDPGTAVIATLATSA